MGLFNTPAPSSLTDVFFLLMLILIIYLQKFVMWRLYVYIIFYSLIKIFSLLDEMSKGPQAGPAGLEDEPNGPAGLGDGRKNVRFGLSPFIIL